jgi:hypothetical protein
MSPAAPMLSAHAAGAIPKTHAMTMSAAIVRRLIRARLIQGTRPHAAPTNFLKQAHLSRRSARFDVIALEDRTELDQDLDVQCTTASLERLHLRSVTGDKRSGSGGNTDVSQWRLDAAPLGIVPLRFGWCR